MLILLPVAKLCEGKVLSDLIASDVVPVTHLSKVFRQASTSSIVLNAHSVNQGKVPQHLWNLEFGSGYSEDNELSTNGSSSSSTVAVPPPAKTFEDNRTFGSTRLPTADVALIKRNVGSSFERVFQEALPKLDVETDAVVAASMPQLSAEVDDALLKLVGREFIAGGAPDAAQRKGDVSMDSLWVATDGKEITSLLQDLVTFVGSLGYDPRVHMQVLAPMHRGELGTVSLNSKLQAILNPEKAKAAGSTASSTSDATASFSSSGFVGAEGGAGAGSGDDDADDSLLCRSLRIRAGDRVMQMRNCYERGIVNGSIGSVSSVSKSEVFVRFDGCVRVRVHIVQRKCGKPAGCSV